MVAPEDGVAPPSRAVEVPKTAVPFVEAWCADIEAELRRGNAMFYP